jgi:hypothetical protein
VLNKIPHCYDVKTGGREPSLLKITRHNRQAKIISGRSACIVRNLYTLHFPPLISRHPQKKAHRTSNFQEIAWTTELCDLTQPFLGNSRQTGFERPIVMVSLPFVPALKILDRVQAAQTLSIRRVVEIYQTALVTL